MFLMPSSCSGLSRTALFSSLISNETPLRGHGRQEIEEVLGVEADLDIVALVLHGQLVPGLADLGVRREQADAVLFQVELDALGALRREEVDPPDGVGKLLPGKGEGVRVILRNDGLIVGELAFDDPRYQGPVVDPEEQVVVVEVEFDRLVVELPESR